MHAMNIEMKSCIEACLRCYQACLGQRDDALP